MSSYHFFILTAGVSNLIKETIMNVLNKKLRLLFSFSLALSIGFPLGVLGIIFGAVKGIVALLVVGIVFTVAGFYAMPLLWVRYGERRGDRTLLFMIEKEFIYTVEGLSVQTGYKADDIRTRINRMIHDHILVGYLFVDDTLVLNTNEQQREAAAPTRKCPNCGAEMVYDGEKYNCDYCLSSFAK